jgi:predicted NUDIX family NTP pyrophosphohydrolase
MSKFSAGILLYRMKEGYPEVLLLHPGGPFHKNKDVWDFPKGRAEEGEESDLLQVAKREFNEETNHEVQGKCDYLGSISHNGRTLEMWMSEGDIDVDNFKSNTTFIEWPPRSGRQVEIPEMDKGEFFSLEEARQKIRPYLAVFLDMFENKLTK